MCAQTSTVETSDFADLVRTGVLNEGNFRLSREMAAEIGSNWALLTWNNPHVEADFERNLRRLGSKESGSLGSETSFKALDRPLDPTEMDVADGPL